MCVLLCMGRKREELTLGAIYARTTTGLGYTFIPPVANLAGVMMLWPMYSSSLHCLEVITGGQPFYQTWKKKMQLKRANCGFCREKKYFHICIPYLAPLRQESLYLTGYDFKTGIIIAG
ncbi:hypothetical protein ILYODFUR_038134 [Ilyodon furcidens]|uniref:Uncharacterized protein n=1 Tax=Ilyodon furcidens TaxID=33524 RepID=A0ABV0T6C7_9TELE